LGLCKTPKQKGIVLQHHRLTAPMHSVYQIIIFAALGVYYVSELPFDLKFETYSPSLNFADEVDFQAYSKSSAAMWARVTAWFSDKTKVSQFVRGTEG
jgi:hypothetical protein